MGKSKKSRQKEKNKVLRKIRSQVYGKQVMAGVKVGQPDILMRPNFSCEQEYYIVKNVNEVWSENNEYIDRLDDTWVSLIQTHVESDDCDDLYRTMRLVKFTDQELHDIIWAIYTHSDSSLLDITSITPDYYDVLPSDLLFDIIDNSRLPDLVELFIDQRGFCDKGSMKYLLNRLYINNEFEEFWRIFNNTEDHSIPYFVDNFFDLLDEDDICNIYYYVSDNVDVMEQLVEGENTPQWIKDRS